MGSTFEGEGWAQSVELGGCLVRVHAVAQRQLGNTAAVLPSKVIRYGLVVLCCVCEGLKSRQRTSNTDDKEIHTLCAEARVINLKGFTIYHSTVEKVKRGCDHLTTA